MAIIRVKKDYPTIQAAVDAASPGDIIEVESGIYNETVTVTKSYLTLVGADDAVLDGQFQLTTGILLNNVYGVKITSLKIKNYKSDAVDINGGSNNVLVKNVLTNNGYFGISLSGTVDTQILCNTVIGNYYGIYDISRNSRIEDNSISFNGYVGIYIGLTEANTDVRHNIIVKNYSYGIICYGNGCRIDGNKISGHMNYGAYLYSNSSFTGNEVTKNNQDGLYLSYVNNIVAENKLNRNGLNGINAGSSSNYSVIRANTALSNKLNGILVSSIQNMVTENTAKFNAAFDLVRIRAINYFKDNICQTSNPPGLCECCGNPAKSEKEEV